MKQLTFAEEYHYKDDDEGIPLQVRLTYAGHSIEVTAKVDPGAAVCLFTHEVGLALGVPVEQGIPKRLGGLTGTLDAFGHEVTPRNLLGRQGWLRNLKLGVIDYDNLLYLSAYGS